METRPLGDTGHDSTVMTFGAIALNWLEQEGANQLVEHVLDYGVNHFDVAPTYGDAELKLDRSSANTARRSSSAVRPKSEPTRARGASSTNR